MTRSPHREEKRPLLYLLSLVVTVYTVISARTLVYPYGNGVKPLSPRQQVIADFDTLAQFQKTKDDKSMFSIETIKRNVRNFTSDDAFFSLRPTRLTSYSYNFLITSDEICDTNEKPFLVIMCLTQYDNKAHRAAIRQTWGSIVKTQKWPRTEKLFSGIKLVVLLGRDRDNNNFTKQASINSESKQYRDIVQADFIDSYYNLTIKVLTGLRWVNIFCPESTFVLKVDDDTFMHVPNLLEHLQSITIPEEGIFIGHSIPNPIVVRFSKWRISERDYPFEKYPEYVSGNSYVISGNVISTVLSSATRMPYISIEDAFIIGILRTAINGTLQHKTGFTWASERAPRTCSFHNPVRISATGVTPGTATRLWAALHHNMTNCYIPPPERVPTINVTDGIKRIMN